MRTTTNAPGKGQSEKGLRPTRSIALLHTQPVPVREDQSNGRSVISRGYRPPPSRQSRHRALTVTQSFRLMIPGKAPSRTGSAPHPPYPHAQKSRTATTRPARCAPRLGPATCQTRMHGHRGRPPSAPPPHSPRLAPALRSVARARGHAGAPRPSASARETGVFGRRLSLAAGAQRAGRVVACISADKGGRAVRAGWCLACRCALRFAGDHGAPLLGSAHPATSLPARRWAHPSLRARTVPGGARRSPRGSGRHCGPDTSPADRRRHSGAARATTRRPPLKRSTPPLRSQPHPLRRSPPPLRCLRPPRRIRRAPPRARHSHSGPTARQKRPPQPSTP